MNSEPAAPVVEPEVLTGEQIRGLLVERVDLETQRWNIGDRIGKIDQARSEDIAGLGRIETKIAATEHKIAALEQRIEQTGPHGVVQQLTTGPKQRIDNRFEIDRMNQEIGRQQAILRGRQNQLARETNKLGTTENTFGGRGQRHRQLSRRHDNINSRINTIDTTLQGDVDARIRRIDNTRTFDAEVVDRYRLGTPTDTTPDRDLNQWVRGVARAEQHHDAWNSQTVSQGTPEWAAHNQHQRGVDTARRQGLNALQNSIPQIHRPGPDLGISR